MSDLSESADSPASPAAERDPNAPAPLSSADGSAGLPAADSAAARDAGNAAAHAALQGAAQTLRTASPAHPVPALQRAAALPTAAAPVVPPPGQPGPRKRPKPGERRVQILQTLAAMLEAPGSDRITTAALAARLQVSEAALYRHFASKAQMYEGLIEFIESSVFTLINQITQREADGAEQARRIVQVLLQFGEKNPGMVRVMVGDALVFEHDRLGIRMNQFFDRVESQLRQCLRAAAESKGSATPTVDAQVLASGLVALAIGRLQRHARSGFRRSPTEQLDALLTRLTH